MNFLTWGRNPWGQTILTHISWSLMWASLFAGLMFLVAHASYMMLSAHHKRSEAETRSALAANNPQARFITPEEVAAAVVWLCAGDSAAITGQAISVSGGETW